MLREHAARSLPTTFEAAATVPNPRRLATQGWTPGQIRGQVQSRRWQRFGRAVVLHNGPLQPQERTRVALLNCGPRAALTAFSAATAHGLDGWKRDVLHILVPAGARITRLPGIELRVHYIGDWRAADLASRQRLHQLAPALVRAAATFDSPRPACAILAAAVQQRLLPAESLTRAVEASPRVRHRQTMLSAMHDVEQGAQALSEIDFARLCRRHGLPEPVRQAVRVEPSGRRRYLDAEWRRPDGRRVVAEVDGALHLIARRWWDDQLRQNELMIVGDLVLRFPSVVVRCEEAVVADQLRRALFG